MPSNGNDDVSTRPWIGQVHTSKIPLDGTKRQLPHRQEMLTVLPSCLAVSMRRGIKNTLMGLQPVVSHAYVGHQV